MGRRALVVTGRTSERAQPVRGDLTAAGITSEVFCLSGEPALGDISRGVRQAQAWQIDLVIGFGGGSALDAAKAIAALMTNEGEPLDYVEVIGKGRSLTRPALALIAVPTTAGTGTEVTRNAVLGSPEHGVKVSLRSPYLLPRLAVIDPELSCSMSPPITAYTGLDALTQLIEPFVSLRANPFTDSLCREGMARVAQSLAKAWQSGADARAREDMSLAALFGGLALANAGLGAVHGLAGPIGGMFDAPHGAICASLLPHVVAINAAALRRQPRGQPTLERYAEIARLLTGRSDATVPELIGWLGDLCRQLEIPRLREFGITAQAAPVLAAKAAAASSMRANPVVLEAEEIEEIVTRAL